MFRKLFEKLKGEDLRKHLESTIDNRDARIEGLIALNQKLNEDLQSVSDDRDRLRRLMMQQAEDTPILSVDIEDGGVTVVTQPPHWAVKTLAGSFLESLGSAENWRVFSLGPIPTDGGSLLVTVQRATGKTPEEIVGDLREVIRQLVDALKSYGNSCKWGEMDEQTEELIVRARSLSLQDEVIQ